MELLGHEGLKIDLGSSGGGQGVSEALKGSILVKMFITCSVLFGILVYFLQERFVHHGCSVALQLLFFTCWTWSRQRRRRGRRPHDVHVRCFEVLGAIHMMAAKSVTWSYLKRGLDKDLTLERASRSLAKTSFLGFVLNACACVGHLRILI